MAPLSILPGRLRLATELLVGRKEAACLIEKQLRALGGVREVSASHRTGRILIIFDEALVSRPDIEQEAKKALQEAERSEGKRTTGSRPSSIARTSVAPFSPPAGHLFREIALHALLPPPSISSFRQPRQCFAGRSTVLWDLAAGAAG